MKLHFAMKLIAVLILSTSLTACSMWGWWGGEDEEEVTPQIEDTVDADVRKTDEKGNILEIDPPEEVEDLDGQEQVIDEDWISMVVPSRLTDTGFRLQAEIKKPLSTIEVVWSHPKSGQEGSYTLKQFESGDNEASYNILAQYENFLPGINRYEMIGRIFEEDAEEPSESYTVSFQVEFDLEGLVEIQPEMIDLMDVPDSLQDEELELEGAVTVAAEEMHVYSWHPESGMATFAQLNKYDSEKRTFEYYGKELFENLVEGRNVYVIDAVNEEGETIARKRFEVRYDKTTLEDTVKEYFGGFERNDEGWYVSQRYPWFLVRKTFVDSDMRIDGDGLVLARPTLDYVRNMQESDFNGDTSENEEVPSLCDYLSEIEYTDTEYTIFKGYSFEMCQTFRYGVSVYDRFLSALKYSPTQYVSRNEYSSLPETVSTAFVMMETPREVADDEEQPVLFTYQMMIEEDLPYQEDQVGDIEETMTDDQRDLFQDVRDFLNEHPGEEMFGWLFPEPASDNDEE